jgi:hypothetical protein
MAGTMAAAGATLLSVVLDAAEVVELDRRVLGSAERAAEMTSVMADPDAVDGSKLAWAVGRRTRKLLVVVVVGEDILRGN